jgi:transcriptional regulator with XRE-family HTH domain
MSSESTPPAKRPITASDREIFRERVKEAFAATGMSQRRAEEAIGMARGTISKLFTGKIGLTLKVLREIAAQAKVGPETLVEGTAFAQLLLEAPETPASKELADALAQVDTLRAELAARSATMTELERHQAMLAAERDELLQRLLDAGHKNDALTAALEQTRTQLTAQEASEKTSRAMATWTGLARDFSVRALAETNAKLQETEKQVAAWRAYALARHQRVDYLESELAKHFVRAQQQPNEEAGRLLLAMIAAFGIGTLAARAA